MPVPAPPVLTEAEREAVRLFGVYTAGRFNFWTLAGNPKATCRAHILSALRGRKATQREAGLTALREAFAAFLLPGVDLCRAGLEEEVVRLCRESGAYTRGR
jgi:hypothetical protein